MRQAGPLSASGEGLDVDFRPWSEDAEFLTERLEEFNAERWPEHKTWWPLGVWRRDAGVITAGLHGESYAGMMFVKFLWVHERVRRQGIGAALLDEAEVQAAARGCHLIWLDTFTFQTPEFYRKRGYRRFAALPTPPFERIFFSKELTPA